MAFLQFNVTVSAASIEINDLGGIVLTTGVIDLGQRYQIEELRYSKDLAFHIHAGDANATDSVGRLIDNSGGVTLAQVETRLNRAGHIFNTDELDEGSTNLYFSEAAARASIGIDPTSEQFMNYDETTGLLSVTNLLITSVDVDTVETSLTTWVANNYTTSLNYQEGDVIILTAATGGSQTWINNGGSTLTIADWTEIQGPDVSDAYIRSLISGLSPLSYNSTTGAIKLLYDNDTVKINSAGEIYVDESALTSLQKTFESGLTEAAGTVRLGGPLSAPSVLTDDAIIDGNGTERFRVQNALIDFSTSTGSYLEVASLGVLATSPTGNNFVSVRDGATGVQLAAVDNFMTIVPLNTSFSNQIQVGNLISGGTAASGMIRWNGTNFQGYNGAWVNLDEQDTNTEYTAGDAFKLTGTEFDVLYDNDSIKVNTAGELYVDESALTSLQTALTFENGLTETTGTVRLGGELTENTTITTGTPAVPRSLDITGGGILNFESDSGVTWISSLLLSAQISRLLSTGSTNGSYARFVMDGDRLTANTDVVDIDNSFTNSVQVSGFKTRFTSVIQVGGLQSGSPLSAGMIRWNGTNFQGYEGTTWVNLDTQGSTPTAGTGIDITGGVISIADTTVTAAAYGSASEVATFTVNAQGQLTAAASTSISITASQVSDFNTAASTEIFDAANFVDGTTIDFTVTSGASVTAEVAVGSLTEDYLSINTPSTGTTGDVLTSDGLGNFEWTDAKKSWTWGAASNANNNTNRFLDRHDGAPTNLTPYVSWYNCELKAISMTQVGTVAWTAEVYVNGVSVATLSSGGNATATTALLSVAISAGDRVSFYVNGTAVTRPAIDAMFETV